MPNKILAIAPGEVVNANFEFHDGTQLVIDISRNGVVGELYMTIASRPAGEIIGAEAELQIAANESDKFVLTDALLGVVQETVKHYHNVWSVRAGTAEEGADANGLVYDLLAKGEIDKLAAIRMVSATVPATAPAFTSNPVISGTLEIGQTLTVGGYSYTGTEPVSEVFQWKRDGANINGATSQTYQLVAVDDGAEITCAVTLANGTAPNATATAPSTGTVTYPAPTATGSLSDATITLDAGNATRDAGALFTGAIGGTWSVTVNGGTNASVATINSAGVVTVYDDATISSATIVATYTNSGGSASRGFSATVLDSATAPSFTATPAISGTPFVGETLTVSNGTVTGTAPITYTYQWKRDGADISGATSQTYVLVSADENTDTTCEVTATNSQESAVATAPSIGTVTASNDAVATISSFTRDKVVFDTRSAFALDAIEVPLPVVSTDAPDGSTIQARVVRADNGNEVYPWRDVGTASGSALAGAVLTQVGGARNVNWLRLEVRVKNSTAAPGQTSNTFGAGHVIDLWGQSEFHRVFLSAFGAPASPPSVADPGALQISYSDATGGSYGTSLQHFFIGSGTNANVEAKMAAMANLFNVEHPGEKYHIVMHTCSGTRAEALVNDNDTNRQWSQDAAITAFALADGQHPGLAIQSWYAGDAPILTSNYGNFWIRAISGLEPDGTPSVANDHYFSDIYDYTKTKWAIAGPHRFENDTQDNPIEQARVAINEAFENPIMQARAVRVLEPLTYENGGFDGSDVAHPTVGVLDGSSRLMELTGYAMLQGLKQGQETPILDRWIYDSGTLRIGSSRGSVTTTRLARSEALPSGSPRVYPIHQNGSLINPANVSINTQGEIALANVSPGDSIIVGPGGIGTDTLPDDLTINEVWKDWPLVDIGQANLEGIPVRGYEVVPAGVIPDAQVPAEYIQANSVANPDFQDGVDNTGSGGMANRTGTDGTANGDGTISIAPSNGLVAMVQPHDQTIVAGSDPAVIDADVMKGTLTDISYYLTSPDGATGDLTVEVKSEGGGSILHDSITFDISGNMNTLLTTQVTPDASLNRIEVLFQRSAIGSSGTLVVHTPLLEIVSGGGGGGGGAPAGYDPAESVAVQEYKDGAANVGNGGWVNRNLTAGTFNGDGTVSIDTTNGLVVGNQKHATTTTPSQLAGVLTDVIYYLSTPDGATGEITVSMVSDGNGVTVTHDTAVLDIATVADTLLTFQVTPDAAADRIEFHIQRTGTTQTGTLVVHAPVLKPA